STSVRPLLHLHSFPTRRSSDLVKRLQGRDSTSMTKAILELTNQLEDNLKTLTVDYGKEFANYKLIEEQARIPLYFAHAYSPHERDRKSTRLNSSHVSISYAVFC